MCSMSLFLSEQNTRKIGGTPTDVEYENGVGGFGGNSSGILNPVTVPVGGSARTLRARMKTTSTNDYISVISYGEQASNKFCGLEVKSNGLQFTGWSGADLASGITVNDGEWHDCVIVYDGTTLFTYVDGVAGNSGNKSLDTTHSSVGIGIRPGSTNNFPGDIDLVEIYNRALSAEEVKNLYENKTYKEISSEDEVMDIDPSQGVIADRWGNTITNTAVTLKKIGNYYAEKYVQADASALTLPGSVGEFGTGDFTVAMWVKPKGFNSLGSSVNAFFGKGRVTLEKSYVLYTESDNKIKFSIQESSALKKISSASAYTNKWICVVARRQSGTLNLFINAVVEADTDTTSQDVSSSFVVNIGVDMLATRYTNMQAGIKKLVGRAWSDEEIMQFYTSTRNLYNK